jgi:hypothetical protein
MGKRIGRVVILVAGVLIGANAGGQFNQDPGTGTGGSGAGSCTYCSQPHCGCAAPPVGYILYYDCACAPPGCSRSCDYVPR